LEEKLQVELGPGPKTTKDVRGNYLEQKGPGSPSLSWGEDSRRRKEKINRTTLRH